MAKRGKQDNCSENYVPDNSYTLQNLLKYYIVFVYPLPSECNTKLNDVWQKGGGGDKIIVWKTSHTLCRAC